MKLNYSFKWALLLSYLVVALLVYLFVRQIRSEIRPLYLESVEEVLVDEANLIAAWLESQSTLQLMPGFLSQNLNPVFKNLAQQRPQAKIYQKLKDQIDTQVYITDAQGIVVFDSEGQALGRDYSQWRDVYLTLQGKYGARSSTQILSDESLASVLHVAAPIKRGGKIIGVVTVRKPTTALLTYINHAKKRFVYFALALVGLILLWGILAARLFAKPLTRLTRYARQVRDNQRAPLPKFQQSEVRETAEAFEQMRQSLAGKKYVEHYVQNLTHELKTPLTSLLGAVELLENKDAKLPTTPENQARLLKNISSETHRLKRIVERMLDLSALEAKDTLENPESVSLTKLIAQEVTRLKTQALVQTKNLTLQWLSPQEISGVVEGDPFLLEAALSNLLQNAVEFSPSGGTVKITLSQNAGQLELSVLDQGPGVPGYALKKVWEKFYSLPRPETGRKSSGLGLSFVAQVMKLHRGHATLSNLDQGGTQVSLSFPVKG